MEKKYNLTDVIYNMIGEVEPIASSEFDSECLENLNEYEDIIYDMISKLTYVSSHKDSPYSSQAMVGKKADKILRRLLDEINCSL